MAGKLDKLKSKLKRWHSRSRLAAADATNSSHHHDGDVDEASAAGLLSVYVGKSRRRYLISHDLVDHPLFQAVLAPQRTVDSDGAALVVGCEVVLFEHLLWMLENGDPLPESTDELAEFYAC